MDTDMRARQVLINAGFAPDDLAVILEGFEDAWAEIGPGAGADPVVEETARMRLAEIVLNVAKMGPIDRGKMNVSAVDAFRLRYGVGA
jgi:hypothetical protein